MKKLIETTLNFTLAVFVIGLGIMAFKSPTFFGNLIISLANIKVLAIAAVAFGVLYMFLLWRHKNRQEENKEGGHKC
jgi:uncharacterized transporter YbjL